MSGLSLIDQIYEAAFLPELWPALLAQISGITGSAAGTMLVFGSERPFRSSTIESRC
jgi:hypothetical protein